jgi:hypothetical protein
MCLLMKLILVYVRIDMRSISRIVASHERRQDLLDE